MLNIGDVRNVDAALEVGALAETITVDATPPPLNTSDSTVGTVITNEQIAALPLNGRDYLQLASLSAGTGPQTARAWSIGGQSGSPVAFLLDGQDNNSQQISTGHSGQKEIVKPSVDAIQEFKVVTNGYSAEYGRSSSGVVSVSLKSGTNQLHGSALRVLPRRCARRDELLRDRPSRPIRRHQFGGAVGFPHRAEQDVLLRRLPRPARIRRETTTRLDAAAGVRRGGQFSRTIIDPLTRLPFPGNPIPASRIDPVAQRILGYVPLPQTGAATNNFVYNSPSRSGRSRSGTSASTTCSARIRTLYVRASSQRTENKPTSPLPPDGHGNYVASGGRRRVEQQERCRRPQRGLVAECHQLDPRRLQPHQLGRGVPAQELRGVGIPGVDTSNPGFSQIAITGYRTLGMSNVPNADDSQQPPAVRRRLSGRRTPHGQDRRAGLSARDRLPQLAAQQRHLQLQRPVHRRSRSPTSCSATRRPPACPSTRC